MMSEKAEDLENALVIAGSERQPFIVSFSDYEDNRLLDIRKYYKDKKSGELKPTRKGVALNRIQYEVLHNVFTSEEEKITAWFAASEDDRTKSQRSHDEQRYKIIKISVEISSWRGLEMFRFKQLGENAVLSLNETHPWISKLVASCDMSSVQDDPSHPVSMLIALLSALFQSIALIDPKNEAANELVDTVLANWGIYAKRYSMES